MSLCRRIARQTLRSSPSFIWISDEYLQTLIRSFTVPKKCIRHGSSVPGPLEARRRSAKRRMMNLASSQGSCLDDGGLSMGMGEALSQKNLKWEPPAQLDQLNKVPPKKHVNPWPLWFAADVIVDDTVQHHLHNAEQHVKKISDALTLEAELTRSLSLEEVRRAAQHHAFVLADYIQLSKLAFRSLLNANPSIPSLTEFLEDQTLNTPKAQNLRALMGWTRLQERPHDELEILGSWLEKQVAFGHFSESELREALVGARRQNQLGKALRTSRMISWKICKKLWAGIQASTVHGVQNLPVETLKGFLEAASQSPLLYEGREMGKHILLAVDASKLKELGPSTVNLVDRLSKASAASSELTFEDRTNLRSFVWFSAVLENLPEPEAANIATTITLALTEHTCNNRAGSHAHLAAWFSALPTNFFQLARNNAECEKTWLLIESNLVSLDIKTLAFYLRMFEDSKIYTFILNHWIPVRLQHITTISRTGSQNRGRNTPVGGNNPNWREIAARMDYSSYYPGADDRTTAYLGIVRELRKRYPLMLRSLIPELLELLRCLERSEAILLIVQYLAKCSGGIESVVVANEVTKHLTSNLRTAIQIFKADPRLRVEDCPGLVERMITEPVSDCPDVFALVERDRGLLGSVGSTVHSKRPLYVNPKRVALLHSMALAYAEAPHLNPRQAYRKVRRCLDFFRDRLDLLGPDMSQALTQAGILRYLEAGMWVSTIRHNYILGYVKHLEGEEVANELDRVVWDWRGRNTHLDKGLDTRESDGGSADP
ncbi:hypothetical protein MMC18_007173 [Xylographa bjoerkii]|nr:hypothetical protein [Xylographa bjoerkii]